MKIVGAKFYDKNQRENLQRFTKLVIFCLYFSHRDIWVAIYCLYFSDRDIWMAIYCLYFSDRDIWVEREVVIYEPQKLNFLGYINVE